MMNRRFEKRLSFILEGMKGGDNRIRILEKIRNKPYNMNQLAQELGLNYRTVKHHVDILRKEEFIFQTHKGNYGNVFFLTSEMEDHIGLLESIVGKKKRDEYLAGEVDENRLYHEILNKLDIGIVITDNQGNLIFVNGAASGIFGLTPQQALGTEQALLRGTVAGRYCTAEPCKKRRFQKHILDVNDMAKTISVDVKCLSDGNGEVIGRCYVITEKGRGPEAFELEAGGLNQDHSMTSAPS